MVAVPVLVVAAAVRHSFCCHFIHVHSFTSRVEAIIIIIIIIIIIMTYLNTEHHKLKIKTIFIAAFYDCRVRIQYAGYVLQVALT